MFKWIKRLFSKKSEIYGDNTYAEPEALDIPDIYMKYMDDSIKLLFTNKENEWSTYEALLPDERQKYLSDLSQVVLYLSNMHDYMCKYEMEREIEDNKKTSKKEKKGKNPKKTVVS